LTAKINRRARTPYDTQIGCFSDSSSETPFRSERAILRFCIAGVGTATPRSTGHQGQHGSSTVPQPHAGISIYYYQQLGYSSHSFHGQPAQSIEGKLTKLQYPIKKNAANPGDLAIRRNYENAIKTAGGEVVYSDAFYSVMKITRARKEVWAEVVTRPGGPMYELYVVEREAMVQVITADAMASAIDRDGFIALDIHFATGKAEVLPESRPTVEQIVTLLKKRPNLKVGVEGHTDCTGLPAANKSLSQARAKSVATEIAAAGISANRLEAVGYEQERPIADNRLEDGRAKNRRVEIVKR
jgi:OOP family OmpA-OmpF porin